MIADRSIPALLLIVLVLPACRQRPQDLGMRDASDEPVVAVAMLSDEDIASIRDAVQQCGGVLRLDERGQPEAIDLAVERASANQSGLAAALKCLGLRSLRIRGSGLTEEELSGIASLVYLEELFLQDVPIRDELLATWTEHLALLRRLTLRNVPGVTSTECLTSLPRLTQLALIDMPIEAGAIRPLTKAKSLVSLDLRMCGRLGGDQLAPLADIAGLKDLKLGGYAIDNQSMAVVASMATLESLAVEDASIDAKGLAQLIPIGTRLRSLRLARCSGLDDDALHAIEAFDRLSVLVLRDMPVTGEFLQHIASPERLETLSLNQTFLVEEAMDAIVRCKRLKRLELAQNVLGVEAIEKISTLVELDFLNLNDCGLDAAALEPLKKLVNLKTLLVDGNAEIDEQIVREILGVTSPPRPPDEAGR